MSGVTVAGKLGPTGLAVALEARQHRFLADEPAAQGGQDSGPAPFELVLGGLAACTAATLRMYAQRKSWPLLGVDVEVEMESGPAGRATIHRRLKLQGQLSGEQRERLLHIANACPAHRLLTQGADIDTVLEETR